MPLCRPVGLCLVLLLSHLAIARASDRSWFEIRSAHFRVITDVGAKRGVEVANRCEQMRAALMRLMPQATINDPAPLIIFALRGQQEVGEFASENQKSRHAGIFIPGSDSTFIVLDATGNPWHTVFHEYAHELLYANSSAATQTWFDEGFAEYFSTLEAREDKVELGRVPIGELQFLRENGKLMRLTNLVSITQDSQTYNQNGPMQATFYAQSWLLVHYLFDRQLIGRAQTFFELMSDGMTVDDAVPTAFGMPRQKLEDDLLAYARGEQFRFFSMSASELQPEKCEVTSLNQVTAIAVELEAKWQALEAHAEKNTAEFAVHYRTLLQQEPNNADALRGLGLMLMDLGNNQESLNYLQNAVQDSPRDASTHHALAQLLGRMESRAVNPANATLSSEQEAAAALALDCDYADAYYLTALAAVRNDRLQDAITSVHKAASLSPRTETYKLTLADLELRERDYSVASNLLHQLSRSRDPEIARKAALFLSANAAQGHLRE